MAERITLKMIALKAGVHYSTVSLALNNHPRIPVATRKRVRALAMEMGYRPDPVLSALVAYRSQKRKETEHGVLAWVDAWPGMESARHRFPTLWGGACERANTFGWKLEEFRMVRTRLSPAKFSRMLRARGIDGLLIAPLQGAGGEMALDWRWFSAVTASSTLILPRLSRVAPYQMYNMRLLMDKLLAMGYQRPGLVLEHAINERTSHNWVATFLDVQLGLPKSKRLSPLILDSPNPRKMLAWRKHHRPDVIISSRPKEAISTLEAAGIRVPGDMGVVSIGLWPNEIIPERRLPPGAGATRQAFPADQPPSGAGKVAGGGWHISGIDERFHAIGAVAIESLVAMINRHETGVPEVPKLILIEGRWQTGGTLRPQSHRSA